MLNCLLKWLGQRTTWLGLFIIYLALTGAYFSFLDDGAASMLVILGVSGLIPEDSPIAHKALEIIAPLLVKRIKSHSFSATHIICAKCRTGRPAPLNAESQTMENKKSDK